MMLKRNIQAITLSGLLLTLTISVFADATSDARKTITGIYQQQAIYLRHKNIDGILKTYAPNYVDIDRHGKKSTAEDTRQNLTRVFSVAKSIIGSITITQLSLKNNTAVATVKGRITAVLIDPQSKKAVTLVESGVSKDTWIKSKSGWLQSKTQELTHSSTQNGHPVPNS